MFFSTKCMGVCWHASWKDRAGARKERLPAACAPCRMISWMDAAGKCSCNRSMWMSSGAPLATSRTERRYRSGAATKASIEDWSMQPAEHKAMRDEVNLQPS